MTKKRLFLFLFFLFPVTNLTAQYPKTDSLKQKLSQYTVDDTVYIDVLNQLANAYIDSQPDSTIYFGQKALQLSQKKSYPSGKINALHVLGLCYFDKGEYEKALKLQKHSLELSQQIASNAQIARSYSLIANIYTENNNPRKAVDYYQKAIKLEKEIGNKYQLAANYTNIGNAYSLLGMQKNRIKYLIKAVKIFNELGRYNAAAIALNNISQIYKEMGKYDKAKSFLFEALKITRENENLIELQRVYRNLATINTQTAQFDSAQYYLNKSLKINKKLDNKIHIAITYHEFGFNYMKQNEYQQAEKFFNKSIAISKEMNITQGLLYNYVYMSKLHFQQNNYKQAENYSLQANKIAKKLEIMHQMIAANKMLYKIYKKQNRYAKALEHFEKYQTIEDSLFSIEKNRQIEEMTMRFETEKKEQENQQLKKENALNQEIIEKQNILNISIVIVLLLVIALMLVFYRGRKIQRQNNEQLKEKNEEILHQAKEIQSTNESLRKTQELKEGLTSMIVHDLKNPLSNIISLPDYFSGKEQLQSIKQSGRQMLQMVMNILEVQRFEEAKIQLERQDLELKKLVEKSYKQVHYLSQAKAISLFNNVSNNIIVNADAGILERIIINLLTNAIKYTPNNGEIFINAVVKNKKWIKIIVTDTGAGISTKEKDLVFSKFGQVMAESSGSSRSTGLGLTFCKLAIEAHGGEIDFNSKPGVGTSFWFLMPLVKGYATNFQKNKTQHTIGIALGDEDKMLLQPYLKKLSATEIYHISKVRSILKEVRKLNQEKIRIWSNRIEQSVFNNNEKQYEKLLSQAYIEQ